jgi:phospholipid/cholesterol/gamma-HCH transport system substrate-binding protein
MLRRTTKIQLALFVIITLLGVSYVSAQYVGLAKYVVGDNGCKISADFTDSGGIFSNAEVTYRGVTVGKVGALHLNKTGDHIDLHLDNCSSPKIPASTGAIIANRSVVGEQYVDLVPPAGTKSGQGPYIQANSNIPVSRTSLPTPTQTLLADIDKFVNSVHLDTLRTTVSELGKAVGGKGSDLGNLLDATNELLAAANDPANLSATISLINDSASVLQTQIDEKEPLQSWTHSLNLLSQQLKASDGDIRHLLDKAPSDLDVVTKFVQNNGTDIGVTLANLITTGNLLVAHLPGVEEVLELYPALAAGGPTAFHNNQGALGLVLQKSITPDPQDCGDIKKSREGYNGSRRFPTGPGALAPAPANVAAQCTVPASTGRDVRGSRNVPGGDPVSITGGGYAYPRVVTDNTVRVGASLTKSSPLSDGSWLGLVTDSLH